MDRSVHNRVGLGLGLGLALRWAEKHLRWPVIVVCQYEVIALTTNTVPPVSRIVNKHKWMIPFVCGVLTAHFWWLKEIKAD